MCDDRGGSKTTSVCPSLSHTCPGVGQTRGRPPLRFFKKNVWILLSNVSHKLAVFPRCFQCLKVISKKEVTTRGFTDWFCCQFALVRIQLTCFLHDIYFFPISGSPKTLHPSAASSGPSVTFYNQMWPHQCKRSPANSCLKIRRWVLAQICLKSIQINVLHAIIVSNWTKQIQLRLINNVFSTLTWHPRVCQREKTKSNFQDNIRETNVSCVHQVWRF